ncbi:MAG: sigma-70 family RNA polymerase sigma factor [Clostridia bacterium]|nr:sigma-70 family RNA polymerase sigma factor [Clostridia bacterium]
MYKRNNGSTEQEKYQNKFTAFITASIRNERKAYLRTIYRSKTNICDMEEEHFAMIPDKTNFVLEITVSDTLEKALASLTDRERYVLISRVIQEKSFEDIADSLGMKYNGVATLYHRTVVKLRKKIGGGI